MEVNPLHTASATNTDWDKPVVEIIGNVCAIRLCCSCAAAVRQCPYCRYSRLGKTRGYSCARCFTLRRWRLYLFRT